MSLTRYLNKLKITFIVRPFVQRRRVESRTGLHCNHQRGYATEVSELLEHRSKPTWMETRAITSGVRRICSHHYLGKLLCDLVVVRFVACHEYVRWILLIPIGGNLDTRILRRCVHCSTHIQ